MPYELTAELAEQRCSLIGHLDYAFVQSVQLAGSGNEKIGSKGQATLVLGTS